MADTKVSGLTAATAFLDADEFPVNEAGTSKKVTGTLLKAWTGNMLQNASTVAPPGQATAAATLVYLTGSNISIPVGKLRIGSWFRWHLSYSKTGAGAAARTYNIRLGTAGTIADTAIFTYTTPASTAVIDAGFTDVYCVCLGPLSASGLFSANFWTSHALQTTGLLNVQTHYSEFSSGTFDVTQAGLIIGISTTSAAAEAITYSMVTAEAHAL